MTWSASAPSNIALIKYMGKQAGNIPSNPSLSYSLEHLRTFVDLKKTDEPEDQWIAHPERPQELSELGKQRFLGHLKRVKEFCSFRGSFLVSSYNDFPSDCGLASSASSFAALTKAAFAAMGDLTGGSYSLSDMSELSRQGSGSSCRSFFSPWSLWDKESARELDLPTGELLHVVAVVDKKKKEVSSSEAHKRIPTSLLNQGRSMRAADRLKELILSFEQGDWEKSYEICWAEFWDMHSLFETSRPSFGYMSAGSLEVLQIARAQWQSHKQGPIVTMDAGPNVHLLFRQDQQGLKDNMLKENPGIEWMGHV